MTNSIKLTNPNINSGNPIPLLNAEFTYGWKNMINTDTRNNGFGIVESQIAGWENPLIGITFYIPMDATACNVVPSTVMSWAQWMSFVRNKYDGTSGTKTTLTMNSGSSDIAFVSYALNSSTTGLTSVPITIKSFTLRVSPDDANKTNWWVINAQIVEDK